ncbi:uncharacterized protein A4U43_C06F4570 [Asparagus officinalis]|uniref:Protein kinase domain-containing protein n=1 Tax=Asparagus officinalis TaxID=4686 RepID=A0A5P1EJM4_ASPOF|nr:uncharacterized protein A4U43_C06F4570 [Asparagus officinalis]
MNLEREEQRLQGARQRKICSPHQLSATQRSPTISGKSQKHRGCCRGLTVIFSFLSETKHPPKLRVHHQVAELKEEVRRQRSQKLTDGAQVDAMQDSTIGNDQHQYPEPDFEHLRINEEVATGIDIEAMRAHAKINGWNIEPQEIEFHEKIGRGTTADIYKGTWRGLNVAIKWIHPCCFQTNEFTKTWFFQELDTLSRQEHPFVLHLLGACLQPPENAWIVTELLSGKTLTEWLYGHKERRRERTVPLPPLQERIEKGLEIAQAMEHLHEQKPKVIHRDLKPSNILLDDCTHVRVADFGHARLLCDGEQALTGEMGTYVYMAPEVIRSEPYDEKCDVYSFGIILNELTTGNRPYSESSYGPSQIALEVAEGRLRPKLPEEDHQHKELIELICCIWNQDASARPDFSIITFGIRKILDKLMLNQTPKESEAEN